MKKYKKKQTRCLLAQILLIVLFISAIYFGCNSFLDFLRQHEEVENVEQTVLDTSTHEQLTGEALIDSLYALARSDERILKIIEQKDEYPEILLQMLSRNKDLTDYVFNYIDSYGQVFATDIGNVQEGEYPLLLQYDERWGYGIYGDSALAINGCGPTSLAMVIAGLTGRNDVTPYKVALFSYQSGYYYGATSWDLFTNGARKYGIEGKDIPLVKSKMIRELEQGHPIICSMRPGDFTTTGHLLVITGVKDGQFIIHDPNSKYRSSKLWDYETLEPQIKKLWSFQKI